MIGRVRGAIPSSRPRRKPGWWHWRVEGRGVGLSPRTVDPPAARRACPAIRTRRWASEPGKAGPRDGLQDLGRARSQAAQEPALAKAGVRSYLEQRDPEFEPKMAEILCVYRQV